MTPPARSAYRLRAARSSFVRDGDATDPATFAALRRYVRESRWSASTATMPGSCWLQAPAVGYDLVTERFVQATALAAACCRRPLLRAVPAALPSYPIAPMKTATPPSVRARRRALGSDTTTGGAVAAAGGRSLIDTFPAAYYAALCGSLFPLPVGGDNSSVAALSETLPPALKGARARLRRRRRPRRFRPRRQRPLRRSRRPHLPRPGRRLVHRRRQRGAGVCRRAFAGTVAVGEAVGARAMRRRRGATTPPRPPAPALDVPNPGGRRGHAPPTASAPAGRRDRRLREQPLRHRPRRRPRDRGPALRRHRERRHDRHAHRARRTSRAAAGCAAHPAAGTPCTPRPWTSARSARSAQRRHHRAPRALASEVVRRAPAARNPMGARPALQPDRALTCNATTMTCESLGNGRWVALPPGGDLNASTLLTRASLRHGDEHLRPALAVGAACQRATLTASRASASPTSASRTSASSVATRPTSPC